VNKVAIITGASRGIGKSAASYFAEQGYDVALIARNRELLEALSDELKQYYQINTGVFALDVCDREAVNACVNQIKRNHASIDVLFNNAGVFSFGTSEISPDDFDKLIDVNLRGVYNFTHAIVPTMKEQRNGYIFNLASDAGKHPIPTSGAYCMTKHGVVGYSQSLCLELAPFNIKVTAICPSVIDTDMGQAFEGFPDEDKITCLDINKTIDYLLTLGPNATVDEVIIKSTHYLKNGR